MPRHTYFIHFWSPDILSRENTFRETYIQLPIIKETSDVVDLVCKIKDLNVRINSDVIIQFDESHSFLHKFIVVSTFLERFKDSIHLVVETRKEDFTEEDVYLRTTHTNETIPWVPGLFAKYPSNCWVKK